jgi:hypothetical protein
MYHDTIHIQFHYYGSDIKFDYSFLISKKVKYQFSSINYGILLKKFDDIGFDLKYIKFNDLDIDETVYCTYNYQPNFEIFFSAYKKVIHPKPFSITFEYGNIINGSFKPNNMNNFAGVFFTVDSMNNKPVPARALAKLNGVKEEVVRGKSHIKVEEYYQIIDKEGNTIENDHVYAENDFETDFFQRYKVKVALRKFKLQRLKNSFDD